MGMLRASGGARGARSDRHRQTTVRTLTGHGHTVTRATHIKTTRCCEPVTCRAPLRAAPPVYAYGNPGPACSVAVRLPRELSVVEYSCIYEPGDCPKFGNPRNRSLSKPAKSGNFPVRQPSDLTNPILTKFINEPLVSSHCVVGSFTLHTAKYAFTLK